MPGAFLLSGACFSKAYFRNASTERPSLRRSSTTSFTPAGSFAGGGPASISWASVSRTSVFQNAAHVGSSSRAPCRNSGDCSDSSCSFSFSSQISAIPPNIGSLPLSREKSTRVSIMYFLICLIFEAYFTACTSSQYFWNSDSVMPGLGPAKMSWWIMDSSLGPIARSGSRRDARPPPSGAQDG